MAQEGNAVDTTSLHAGLIVAVDRDTTPPVEFVPAGPVDFSKYGITDTAKNPKLYSVVKSWLSTRYRYGGHGEKGIDCSGFTKAVYREAYNINLTGGGSASIYNPDVVPVERDSLEEGDMVFFKIRRRRISHIGVYLGNNKFAHAARHGGVIISDLNHAYYKKRYFKAGRHKSFVYAEQQNTGTK